MSLNIIQTYIKTVLLQLSLNSRTSEAVLAKKIREISGLNGKKKAGIALNDLINVIDELEQNNVACFAVILNSSNEFIVEKVEQSRPLDKEAIARRQKSEKSMQLFTNQDFKQNKSSVQKTKKRTESKKLNIYGDFDSYED